jgi:hypothetical protein
MILFVGDMFHRVSVYVNGDVQVERTILYSIDSDRTLVVAFLYLEVQRQLSDSLRSTITTPVDDSPSNR